MGYTPGLWRAEFDPIDMGWWVAIGDHFMARLGFGDAAEADARLMAAAPSMLAALRKIVATAEFVERANPTGTMTAFEEFIWQMKSMADDAIPQGIGEPERPTP